MVLYPISRGKNWGYGDACPTTDGAAIVDLSRMNQIVEVNTDLAYCVVEPGVSQKELFDYLKENDTGLWMDATAAGPNASLVGNTVDRGFGHTWYGDHFLTCCGMEVVLADGRVVRTGFGHYPNARATRVHRYGVGPMLDGLFCQSNQGIVLRIGLWLQPAPEAFEFFYFQAPNEEVLATLVDRLRPLRLDGTLRTAVYIANDFRVLAGHAGYPWEEANDQTPLPHDVRMGLNRFGLAKALAIKLDILRPNYDLLKGIPTPEPLLGQQWRLRNPPDDGPCDLLGPGCGFYWISPAMPMLGPEATELRELVEPIFAEHG
ncbi:MAG: FAD-binding protein, partial [Candidatus Hydrogenedentes bacterium]|nr:FAD-binding protein [Candidatus Hydrogenedentota bacterium]